MDGLRKRTWVWKIIIIIATLAIILTSFLPYLQLLQ